MQQGTAADAAGEKTHVGVVGQHSRRRDDMVYRTARQRETERTDARKGFVLERVDSCGGGDESGRRTKLDFGSSQSFDDRHRSTTLGAESRIVEFMGGR